MSKKMNWGFDTRHMDKRVRPQDDFYRYVHGTWLKTAKIPPHESRWGSFLILRVEVEKQLRKLVDELAKQPRRSGRGPDYASGMIADFYKAAMDEGARERLGTKPIASWLAKIESIKSVTDVIEYLAILSVDGFGGLWGAAIDQDSKRSDRYILHLYQSGLGMPDRDYYLKTDAESVRVRTAYTKHIEALMRLMGDSVPQAAHTREVVMRIETALAEASMPKEELRDSEAVYHKLSLAQLKKQAPNIEWELWLKEVGIKGEREFIVMQPKFFEALSQLIVTTSLEDWRTYLRFHLINDAAGGLSKSFVRQQFSFYTTTLTGTKQMKPLWRRALGATNGTLGELLGQVYVKHHFTKEAKSKMGHLVDDLFAAYAERIKGLDWMSPATRVKALKKLKMVARKIGYPDKWKSYKGLEVAATDYFGNLVRSSRYEHKRALKKLGKPIDRTEWFMTPQTVNAYCSFNMNEIVFPAAILQPPFFNLAADDAINYGSIGSVIGHEITHAFDDQGSKFDGKGNMKSWWSAADRKRFDAKAAVVKKQYDQYKVADGVPVNGQLTLGENIADLGGASIAYDAYQRQLARTGRRDIGGFTPEQRFFIGFALFDMELTRPEAQKLRVLTDPHSPAEFRINGPVSNLPEFYAAFGVTKGDKLYRPSASRAKIW